MSGKSRGVSKINGRAPNQSSSSTERSSLPGADSNSVGRATGRTPAGALMVYVEDLIYPARQLTGMRAAHCDRVHLFGSGNRIHGERPGWMRSDAAGLWKPECVVIRDQDCSAQHACGHRATIYDGASHLLGSGQPFVIPFGSSLCGLAAELAVYAACCDCCHRGDRQNRHYFNHSFLFI